MGVSDQLASRRMEQAKLLLETANMQAKEIASVAGYTSTAAFIHAFRKIFSLTLREWRRWKNNLQAGEAE